MAAIFTKIIAFFTSIAVAFGSFFCLFKADIPDPKTADELLQMNGIFEKRELADKIYVIEGGRTSSLECNPVICLQGLVNRDKAQLFYIHAGSEKGYLDEIAASGRELIYNDADGNKWTFASLLEQFRDYITDSGFVLYRNSEFAEGLNMAFNYATVNGWLAVPVELKSFAEEHGLKMMKDISGDEYNYKFQEEFFDKYKDEFSSTGLVHVKEACHGLRDFAIQQRLFIFYTQSDVKGDRFLKKVLNKTGENGMLLGWCEEEKHFVKLVSKQGYSLVASDHSYNISVLNNFDCEIPELPAVQTVRPDPDKHYIALIMSDGDNVQWVGNGYNEFYRGQAISRSYPVTWGFPCMCQEITPVTAKAIYSAVRNDGDCFMAGPSGIGYALPSAYEDKSMDRFTTDTAAAMLKSGLRVACILDDEPSAFREAAFARKFDYYSRFDNIDGGIIFLDPSMYSSGEGRVWFSNDKPFLTLKNTLWTSEGYDGVTKEWMQEQADIINSYPADNSSINGYSAIGIHAWSVTPENLDYLVSLLDDHIEIVNINTLVSMIAENIPHEYAKPE